MQAGTNGHKSSIQLAVPTYGNIPAICLLSFGSLCAHAAVKGTLTGLGQIEGAYIDRARNDLVKKARANGHTHIMFMDQDMILPEDTISRLLQADTPIVGGSYFGKDDFFTPVSFHLDPFRRVYDLDECPKIKARAPLPRGARKAGLSCWCGDQSNHLHKIGGTGMGCTLVSVQLFTDMEAYYSSHPCPCGSPGCTPQRWFSSVEVGEDVHFAMRCKQMGIDWLLDGFVQCGHVRNHIVTAENYRYAKQNAAPCQISGCGKVGYWNVAPVDQEPMIRCFDHKGDE